MEIAFLIIGIIIYALLIWAIGNMGKDTPLGIWGAIAISMVITPVLTFLLIMILFKPKRGQLIKIYRVPVR